MHRDFESEVLAGKLVESEIIGAADPIVADDVTSIGTGPAIRDGRISGTTASPSSIVPEGTVPVRNGGHMGASAAGSNGDLNEANFKSATAVVNVKETLSIAGLGNFPAAVEVDSDVMAAVANEDCPGSFRTASDEGPDIVSDSDHILCVDLSGSRTDGGLVSDNLNFRQKMTLKIRQAQTEDEFEPSDYTLSPKQVLNESALANTTKLHFDKSNDSYDVEIAGLKHTYDVYYFIDPVTSKLGPVDCKSHKASYICTHCQDDFLIYGFLVKHMEVVRCGDLSRTIVSRTYLQRMDEKRPNKKIFLLDILMTLCTVSVLVICSDCARVKNDLITMMRTVRADCPSSLYGSPYENKTN